MNKFMTKNRDRFAVTLAVLATAIALTACGGGGGGGTVVTPPPVTTPAPTVLLSSVVPATGATNVSVNVRPVFTFAVTNVTAINTVTAFVCNSKQITYLATADLTSKAGSATISFAPMVALTNGDSCTMSSDVTATGAGGSAKTTVNTSFTVEAAPVVTCQGAAMMNSVNTCVSPPAATGYTWNNVIKAWVANIGTNVVGLNELPLECTTIGDACWKASTASGAIKYFETNAVATGINSRKLVVAGIIVSKKSSFAAGNFTLIPVYPDSESDTPYTNLSILNGSNTDGVVNLKGSDGGVKFTTPTNGCWEWGRVTGGWANHSTACPI